MAITEWRSQYQKASADDFNIQGNYDYYSVMHYPVNAPGTTKSAFEISNTTIDTKRVGQRDGPTETDIRKVHVLYECRNTGVTG